MEKLVAKAREIDHSIGAKATRYLLYSDTISLVSWTSLESSIACGKFTGAAGKLWKQSYLEIRPAESGIEFKLVSPAWTQPFEVITKVAMVVCVFIPPMWIFVGVGLFTFWQYGRSAKIIASRITNELVADRF